VCSTFAGSVLGQSHPGLLSAQESSMLTPNQLARMSSGTKPQFHVSGMQLPERMTTPNALRLQNLAKWKPLALRSPLIAGLGTMGALTAASGLSGLAQKTGNKLGDLLSKKSPPITPPTVPAPEVGGWWGNMMNQFGGVK
jgi:hypothetical protein